MPGAPAGDNDHSSRSQVRGCLKGGAKQSLNADIGVRVDGISSIPSGAILANKGEQSRKGGSSKVNGPTTELREEWKSTEVLSIEGELYIRVASVFVRLAKRHLLLM